MDIRRYIYNLIKLEFKMNVFTAINTVLASLVQVVVTSCTAVNRVAQSVDNLAHIGQVESEIALNGTLLESEEKIAQGNARLAKIRADIATQATQQSTTDKE